VTIQDATITSISFIPSEKTALHNPPHILKAIRKSLEYVSKSFSMSIPRLHLDGIDPPRPPSAPSSKHRNRRFLKPPPGCSHPARDPTHSNRVVAFPRSESAFEEEEFLNEEKCALSISIAKLRAEVGALGGTIARNENSANSAKSSEAQHRNLFLHPGRSATRSLSARVEAANCNSSQWISGASKRSIRNGAKRS
jgi:hypothetical protein